jgi:hypothetical protein
MQLGRWRLAASALQNQNIPISSVLTRAPPHRQRGALLPELAVASREAEALLRSISESTAVAEKEKAKVAVIVGEVSSKAAEIAAVKVIGRPAALGPL